MDVEKRLARLERENRRLKVVGVLTLMMVASVLVMGQTRPMTYTGDMFTLSRPAGGTAGLLWTRDGRPSLSLFGGADGGNDRANMAVIERDLASV